MKILFQQALELKRKQLEYQKDDSHVIEIESKANGLMDKLIVKTKTPKTLVFQNAMKKNRQSLFQFLYHEKVPPDNNGSERGVRNFKVHPVGYFMLLELRKISKIHSTFFCSVPIPERKPGKSKIRGTLYSENELKEIFKKYGFEIDSKLYKNGAVLYFTAVLKDK